MKQKFSTKWLASKQPRKQRKYLHNLPNHLKQKLMSVTLTKDLRKKYGVRNIGVRKGDEVEVMRGKFKKKTGKVIKVNFSNKTVSVENIQITKKDGNKVEVKLKPSVLRIKTLVEDKKRFKRKVNRGEKNAQEKK